MFKNKTTVCLLDETECAFVNERLTSFGIKIDREKIFYSKKMLMPWHGAMTCCDGKSSTIQLHPKLRSKKKLYGLYNKFEIIAHEWIHIQRIHLNAPLFEEVIAYQTSSSFFRRFFGPIFNPLESIVFVVLATAACVLQLFSPVFLLMPVFYFTFCMAKLCVLQTLFKRCRKVFSLKTVMSFGDKDVLRFS
ncbi:MAG: hypothetical protein K940chlam8_01308 [Chlamydiae bacterium]|nr:hypothetical protein [Chlamydiota bacterium]